MAENRKKYTKLLEDVLINGQSFSTIKNELDDNEKGFVNMLFMTCFRNLEFIKSEVLPQFVKKRIPEKQQILTYVLVLATTEILFLNTPQYAILNSYVEIAKDYTDKFGANFVNAVLRNITRNKENLLVNRKVKYFSKNFLKILKQDYSPTEIAEMEKFVNIEPCLDVTLKNNEYANMLDGDKLKTGSVRFKSNTKVTEIKGFEQGEWWVQDAASALAVKCFSNLKNKTVLDLCAAPGGKTAQLLSKEAIVTAIDISEDRINILKENLNRLKLNENIIILCENALNYSPQEKFDFVLIDAPCSATGTFRRHPEIIHTKTYDDVKKLTNLQKDILNRIDDFLKPNGELIYATCSLSKLEGEKQINDFLKIHNNYSILPINIKGCENIITKNGYLRVLPQLFDVNFGADGFFIAHLKRNN